SRHNRVHVLRPNGLPCEQALFSRPYHNDYCRVGTREMHNSALRIHACSAVPAIPHFVPTTAGATKVIALVPVYQGFGISEKRSILSRKQRRNGSQVPESPRRVKSAGHFFIYVQGKIRVSVLLAKKKSKIFFGVPFQLLPLQ